MNNNTQKSIQRVIDAVCQAYGVTERQLCTKTRVKEIVSARHMFFKVCREQTGMTYKALGSVFTGEKRGYDHSTIMHAISTINDLMSVNDDIVMQKYDEVMSILRQKSDKLTTVHIKVWPDQAALLYRFLQREEIPFTVLDGVNLQETKSTEDEHTRSKDF